MPTLSDPKVRADLRKEIETATNWENWYHHVGRNWDNVLVVQVPAKVDKQFEGKSVAEITALRHADVWDTFFYLVQQGGVDVDPKSLNEEQKQQALRAPFVSIGSDAEPMNPATSLSASTDIWNVSENFGEICEGRKSHKPGDRHPGNDFPARQSAQVKEPWPHRSRARGGSCSVRSRESRGYGDV